MIITLAWPIILARSTQAVMGFWDALMVGPLGGDALAASGTAGMNSFALMILPMGTVFIVQSFVAQLVGKQRLEETHRYGWYGLMIAAVAGVVSVIALPFIPFLLSGFDYTPNVRHLMEAYLVMRLPSVFAVVGSEALGNWYGGLGNTRLQMISSVCAMVVDMFLNWAMIYGHAGFPAMGVAGAALSSTIGSYVGFAVLAYCFARGLGGAPPRPARLGLRWRELRRMLRFGLPNGANWLFEFAAFLIFINVVVAHLGTPALAALNVVMQVNSVAFMPSFGLASAGAILVGQAVGAGHKDDVWPIVRRTGLVAMTWMGSLGLLYLIFARPIVALFAREGSAELAHVDLEQVRAIGATMLMMSTAWQAFDAIAMTLSETLRAAGDSAWTLGARLVLAWVVFAPAGWFFVMRMGGGAAAAMGCLIGYMLLLAAAFSWRFASGAWRKIELIEEPVLDAI